MFTGDAGAYLESEQAAAAAFERAGDLRNTCVQRGNVGYACLEIGAYAEAERALRDALDQATRLGLANVAATVQHNLGRALMMRGALDEALRVESDAFEAFAGGRRSPARRCGTRVSRGDPGGARRARRRRGRAARRARNRAATADAVRAARAPRARAVRAGRAAESPRSRATRASDPDQLGAIEEGDRDRAARARRGVGRRRRCARAEAALAAARERLLDRAARSATRRIVSGF